MSLLNDELVDFSVEPLAKGNFVTPLRLTFNQCGRRRAWELIRVHESVGIIAFNVTRSKLLFVRQFRPAVYFNGIPNEERQRLIDDATSKIDTIKYPVTDGYTLELCAGIVDKSVSLEEISAVELEEELGLVAFLLKGTCVSFWKRHIWCQMPCLEIIRKLNCQIQIW